MKKYSGHKSALVADVDCTAAGKPLCDSNGVKGFPTIKYGDPSALEDYKGGRDFDALKEFEELMKLDADELDKRIAEGDKKIADAEAHFKAEVEKLQAAYQKLMSDKDETIEDVKSSGL